MNSQPVSRNPARRHPSGYVSTLLVLSMGFLLTLLMVFTYRRALASHSVQAAVQLEVDYSEKEEAILRSIVAITPNRAIRAMQTQSNANPTNSNPLRWENIFGDALVAANARQSISSPVLASLGGTTPVVANTGDSSLTNISSIFKALGGEAGYMSAGINRSLGTGFPVPLTCANTDDMGRDPTWPIIAGSKVYGTLAQSGVALPVDAYPNFNIITYPNINFGYTRPGQPFVAKRNWWGFSMDLAEPDALATSAVRMRRDFVLSIYEIPSQLPISASSFMELGQHAEGDAWQNVTIASDSGIFAGRALVEGTNALPPLATRRGATLSVDTTVGGQSFTGDPFTPGVREAYQLTQGTFFPVSLASESGRAAFIPINRGTDYFDRFKHAAETDVLSSTTWDNYSIGALQCAMRLDVTGVTSAMNNKPTKLRFSYLKAGIRVDLPLLLDAPLAPGLDPKYLFACGENETYDFGSAYVDVAFGSNGNYAKLKNLTGRVTFNAATFGPGVSGQGYFLPSYPFEVKSLLSGQTCLAIYPQSFAAFLAVLGADSTAVNNSLAVNVDYSLETGSTLLTTPAIPCTDQDYGVILQQCSDLTSFSKGFSLVTNLRLYFGDDFNTTPATPPAGYTPAGTYYPPCSIFTPEKRYGVEVDPFGVNFSGQVGSVIKEDDPLHPAPVRPLDSKTMSGATVAASHIHVNLRPIIHPADLPPISMMNWLVLLEERRREYFTAN